MLAMNPQRILLVEQPKSSSAINQPKIRHYRLARLRLAHQRDTVDPRHAHLRRSYD